MEVYSSGGHRKKRPSKAKIQAMKEGHKEADAIRAHRESHHAQEEIPQAEALLEEHLEQWPAAKKTNAVSQSPTPVTAKKTTWWQRILQQLRNR